jgi:hypothetical protein
MIARRYLTTMFDESTTREGTVGFRRWDVDYRIITEAA